MQTIATLDLGIINLRKKALKRGGALSIGKVGGLQHRAWKNLLHLE